MELLLKCGILRRCTYFAIGVASFSTYLLSAFFYIKQLPNRLEKSGNYMSHIS
jgi:hypothetical protein